MSRSLRSQSTMALEHRTTLDIYNEPHKVRKTGIVCTIGPKTNDVDVLVSLVDKGMCIVRLNFSHGNHKYHASVIANARAAAARVPDCVLGIALDTKGPEIRTGTLKNDEDIRLEVGQDLVLTSDESRKEDGDVNTVYVDYVNLPKVIKVGQHVFMDDGLISLEVTELGDNFVKTRVVNSGMLGSHKGVNLPNVNVDLPAVSEKDKEIGRASCRERV